MWDRYRDWMHARETRLNARDTNRVVRPLEWGLDWTEHWPLVNGAREAARANPEAYLAQLNEAIVASSDDFYAYQTPSDFRREGEFLFFTSPVHTPYAVNNLVRARWFPCGHRRALVVLPQWNAEAEGHNGLCRIFNMLGFSALRQAVIDARACLDWLEMQGYKEFGIVGTSLGSCYAFLASAHDPRFRVNVFNHFSVTFGDVVWTGQSTHHVRQGIEDGIDQDRLRRAWMAISPIAYVDKFERWPKQSLLIYAACDLTFLPVYSHQFIDEFQRRGLPHQVAVLPCGHYTTAESPFKYLDAYYMASFLQSAFN